MSGFRRIELFQPSSSALFCRESSLFYKPNLPLESLLLSPPFPEQEELDFALDLLNPITPSTIPFDLTLQCPLPPSSLGLFGSATHLIQIERTPFYSSFQRFQDRSLVDFHVRSLCDRVSALELGFDRVLADRKYKWTAEIKGSQKNSGVDRKYKCVAEIKGGAEKNYKWTAEIKGKGKDAPMSQTYTFTASTGPPEKASKKKKESLKKTKTGTHVVEIEETDRAAIALKQAFAKSRAAAGGSMKGKKKELSPQDAALIIQMSFRAHLVRRSQVLRGLRELAVAKAKLKELRALFTNFSYRRRIVRDAEERQRFSEKIIVLLLTVDSIEGPDYMVRAAQRSLVAELEAMLDVMDPQPTGKLGSMKRRKFDLPENGPVQKEMALGVAGVVQMLDQGDNGSSAFTEASM